MFKKIKNFIIKNKFSTLLIILNFIFFNIALYIINQDRIIQNIILSIAYNILICLSIIHLEEKNNNIKY